jgi:uncharacterized phage protein (TIGR01671 family)
MREIKFRAWIPEEKQMYTWNPRFFSDMSPVTGFSDEFPSDDSVILMQYTGLHDKNGKEIYEGDIVTLSIQGIPQIPLETIIWNNTQGGFALFFQEVDPYFRVDLDSIEVIGNIYENLKDEHPR